MQREAGQGFQGGRIILLFGLGEMMERGALILLEGWQWLPHRQNQNPQGMKGKNKLSMSLSSGGMQGGSPRKASRLLLPSQSVLTVPYNTIAADGLLCSPGAVLTEGCSDSEEHFFLQLFALPTTWHHNVRLGFFN